MLGVSIKSSASTIPQLEPKVGEVYEVNRDGKIFIAEIKSVNQRSVNALWLHNNLSVTILISELGKKKSS